MLPASVSRVPALRTLTGSRGMKASLNRDVPARCGLTCTRCSS